MSESPQLRGAIAWMAKNPVCANLLLVALLFGGLLSANLMVRQEVFPPIEPDIVSISVPYPGASPSEVESGILLALEEALRPLDGVKQVNATASEGVGSVTLELLNGVDKNKALTDVKNAVDRIVTLPDQAERPIVMAPTYRSEAISIVIFGDQSEAVLREVGEQARNSLLDVDGISYVELSGVRPFEISVEIPQEKLRAHGLTLPEVARTIRATAVEMPAGGVKTASGEVLLRTAERRELGAQYRDIPIASGADGAVLRLSDIALIRDGFADVDLRARYNGKPAVVLEVYSVGDESPTEIAATAKQFAAELSQRLPPGLSVQTWGDMSELYQQRLDLLLRNATQGLIIVLILLGAFLEPRIAFWVAMGIPTSFLGALLMMPVFGISLNMVTLFAFLITLGVVVDDAIVVGEHFFELRRSGRPSLECAAEAARLMARPVFFSVATTIVAFFPLLFIPGTRGKFMYVIPAVVIMVLLTSILESFFVLPAHLAALRSPGPLLNKLLRPQRAVDRGTQWFIEKLYGPALSRVLRERWITLAVAIALVIGSVGIVAGGRLKFVFWPKEESDWINVDIRLPFGSSIDDTEAVVNRVVASAHQAFADSGGMTLSRGIYSIAGYGEGGQGSHRGLVVMSLVPGEERAIGSAELSQRWRKAVGQVPGVEAISFDSSTGHGGATIDIELSHRDTAVLEDAARELAGRLAEFKGTKDIDPGIELGKPQWSFTLSPTASALGLSTAELASQVRASFYGVEALRQQRGRNELRVMVRLPMADRRLLASVEDLVLRTPKGGELSLRDAAAVEHGHSYTVIRRTDGKRTIRVKSEVDEKESNSQEIIGDVFSTVLPELEGRYPGLSAQSSGRQKSNDEFLDFMKFAYFLALLGIYVLIAIPLGSYAQPFFVVMMSIPFGIIGAIFGHLLLGYDLSLISLMGMVALSGVVVNDAIVLTDAANTYRDEGCGAVEAALRAGKFRFRAVFLTTATTFGGLMPMILERSLQARMLVPMAISLGCGVLFSTFVTLFVVPVLYSMIETARGLFRRDPEPGPGPLRSIPPSATAALVLAALFASPGAKAQDGPQVRTASLDEVLSLAQQRSPTLQRLEQEIEIAKAQLHSAWGALLPSATSGMTLTHLDHEDSSPGLGVTRPQNTLTGNVQLSVPLVSPTMWANVAAGRAGREKAQYLAGHARIALMAQVARTYYNGLGASSLIATEEALLAAAKRHAIVAETRYLSGVGRQLEVVRAKVEIVQIERELRAARLAFDSACDALGLLTGQDGPLCPKKSVELDSAPAGATQKNLLERALDNRADLKANAKAVEQARHGLDAARLALAPTLAASWSLTHQFTEPGVAGSTDRTRSTALLNLAVPLYTEPRYAQIDGAKAAVRMAEIAEQDARRSLAFEVRGKQRAYSSAASDLASADEQARLSRILLELAQSSYENGMSSSLEITDASRAARQAEIALARQQVALQEALVALLLEVGQPLRSL
ncbi:MAG: efflux RND transporter permease subunit [Myxococcota bacterium]|nr:efflux RND transporter permease subunit [Myxococcota bacterium]